MKKCPACGRLFPDASLKFCRMDGARLVDKSVRADEALTIQFSTGKLNELRHKKAQKTPNT